jgi:prophage antirepressor|nr:MAG TPA: antirepressor protein [Caudoviricetes sp.]
MNTQTRDEAFGFKRTKGNLYNILDAVGTKMQKDLDKFLNVRTGNEHVLLEEVVSPVPVMVGDMASAFTRAGYSIGRNTLFEKLREDGFLGDKGLSRNLPTKRSRDAKLITVKETRIETYYGTKIQYTPLITPIGQMFFYDLYVRRNH